MLARSTKGKEGVKEEEEEEKVQKEGNGSTHEDRKGPSEEKKG